MLYEVITFAKYLKENSKEIGIERCLFSIEKIFDVLSKFKYEEDKRLLGYVVLYHLSGLESIKTSVKTVPVVEKVAVREPQSEPISAIQISGEATVNIQEVREKWNEVVRVAKSKKITLIALLNGATP